QRWPPGQSRSSRQATLVTHSGGGIVGIAPPSVLDAAPPSALGATWLPSASASSGWQPQPASVSRVSAIRALRIAESSIHRVRPGSWAPSSRTVRSGCVPLERNRTAARGTLLGQRPETAEHPQIGPASPSYLQRTSSRLVGRDLRSSPFACAP